MRYTSQNNYGPSLQDPGKKLRKEIKYQDVTERKMHEFTPK